MSHAKGAIVRVWRQGNDGEFDYEQRFPSIMAARRYVERAAKDQVLILGGQREPAIGYVVGVLPWANVSCVEIYKEIDKE